MLYKPYVNSLYLLYWLIRETVDGEEYAKAEVDAVPDHTFPYYCRLHEINLKSVINGCEELPQTYSYL